MWSFMFYTNYYGLFVISKVVQHLEISFDVWFVFSSIVTKCGHFTQIYEISQRSTKDFK